MKLEREATVSFVKSDDFDKRQANVDNDRLSVVDHRANVSTVTVWIEQRREKTVLVGRSTAVATHLTSTRHVLMKRMHQRQLVLRRHGLENLMETGRTRGGEQGASET